MATNNVIIVLDTGIKVGDLEDVNDNILQTGSTLIYDSNTDTYIVKKLNINMFSGDIDGGTY
jgi:L-aminopeptidase/D-esterase-like protein